MTLIADILPKFQSETISFPDDYDGEIVATLISRKARYAKKAVLYLHGYCDYFFQTELAEFYNELGYNFYAIDLRKYGRSLRPGQNFNFCKDLSEYYEELEAAIDIIRNRDKNGYLLLNGHSTGGLLASLYAEDRKSNNTIDALFLNSPFFDFNDKWFTETFLKTVVTGAGLLTPHLPIPSPGLPLYGESISAAYDRGGDQVFDEKWKPASSWNPPMLAGWIRAIRLGHIRVHAGLSIQIPTLVMHSDKSGGGKEWNESFTNSDCVLNVSEIQKYASTLNNGHRPATQISVLNGIHDLTCSRPAARAEFYSKLKAWLTRLQ